MFLCGDPRTDEPPCALHGGVTDTITMSRPTDEGHQCALRHRLASTLAAMLLIIHWAAPSFRPFDLPRSSGESIPIYTLAEIGPYHGTLPRLLARAQGVEVTLPKPKRHHASSDDSEAGLPSELRFEPARGIATVLTAAFGVPRIAAPTQPFQARAPPSATA